MYVIERMIDKRAHYYAGYIAEYSPRSFSDSGIQWNLTMTQYTKFDGDMADKIIKQLAEMGITDCEKKMILEKRPKGPRKNQAMDQPHYGHEE